MFTLQCFQLLSTVIEFNQSLIAPLRFLLRNCTHSSKTAKAEAGLDSVGCRVYLQLKGTLYLRLVIFKVT